MKTKKYYNIQYKQQDYDNNWYTLLTEYSQFKNYTINIMKFLRKSKTAKKCNIKYKLISVQLVKE